jgi:hypothetical protein
MENSGCRAGTLEFNLENILKGLKKSRFCGGHTYVKQEVVKKLKGNNLEYVLP